MIELYDLSRLVNKSSASPDGVGIINISYDEMRKHLDSGVFIEKEDYIKAKTKKRSFYFFLPQQVGRINDYIATRRSEKKRLSFNLHFAEFKKNHPLDIYPFSLKIQND